MKMAEERAFELFDRTNARKSGHFVLSSGLHTGLLIDGKSVLADVQVLSLIAEHIARNFARYSVDTVITVSPTIGSLGFAVAERLSRIDNWAIASATAERGEYGYVIHPRYHGMIWDKNVLVLEDVLTTGDSLLKVVESVRHWRGNPAGVAVLWDRKVLWDPWQENLRKYMSLVAKRIGTYGATTADPCPLCAEGVPIDTTYGHGGEYLKAQETKK